MVGTSDGRIARTDDGLTAGPATTWPATRPREGFVTWVAFDPSDPNLVYATYGGFGGHHVWRSTDGGALWSPHDGNGDLAIPDLPVHCLLVDPAQPDRLYLGTDLGVLVSLDGGASWAAENTGFAHVVTESLALTTDAGGTRAAVRLHPRPRCLAGRARGADAAAATPNRPTAVRARSLSEKPTKARVATAPAGKEGERAARRRSRATLRTGREA